MQVVPCPNRTREPHVAGKSRSGTSGGAHKPRSRKYWGAAETGRVTVFRPPATTLGVRTGVHMAVGPTVPLISSTNSGNGAGQLSTMELPMIATASDGGVRTFRMKASPAPPAKADWIGPRVGKFVDKVWPAT